MCLHKNCCGCFKRVCVSEREMVLTAHYEKSFLQRLDGETVKSSLTITQHRLSLLLFPSLSLTCCFSRGVTEMIHLLPGSQILWRGTIQCNEPAIRSTRLRMQKLAACHQPATTTRNGRHACWPLH